jgi:hypothetical protein
MVGEKNVTRNQWSRIRVTFLRGEKMKNGNGVQWEKWGNGEGKTGEKNENDRRKMKDRGEK